MVSPLVALMEDQLMALKKWNVEAAMLSATATREHTNYVFNVRPCRLIQCLMSSDSWKYSSYHSDVLVFDILSVRFTSSIGR